MRDPALAERTMKRVRRMASAVPSGQLILEFLQTPEARKLLREAAESGRPPIGAISPKLTELIEPDVLKLMLVKQFCGLATRAVLVQEGFVPSQIGVRVRDPVFTSGTVYAKRVGKKPKSTENLLKRVLDTLSLEELQWAASYLAQRIDLLDSLGSRRERNLDTKILRKRPKKDGV
jgi:hypothetical protein